jgi:hypothetical protein
VDGDADAPSASESEDDAEGHEDDDLPSDRRTWSITIRWNDDDMPLEVPVRKPHHETLNPKP